MNRSTRTTTRVETRHRIVLSRQDVLDMLGDAKFRVPRDVDPNVYMNIPGGADWSNTELYVGSEERGLVVEWVEITESES